MQSKHERYEKLRAQLENERSSFEKLYREVDDYIYPGRYQFSLSDTNRGDRRSKKILDTTGTFALRTLGSGMSQGITNPARQWKRITVPDPDLAEFGRVKQWLHTVSLQMDTIFLRSNVYNVFPTVYRDMGGFGTAAMLLEEDAEHVIRAYCFPPGSYFIANDAFMRVRVFYRQFQMTVRQLVETFGTDPRTGKINWEPISLHVKNLWDQGQYETWVDVCHVIEPNAEYDPRKLESKFKRYASCYYERGSSPALHGNSYLTGSDDKKLLREKGYDFFPVFCPRWFTSGSDVYATDCPGFLAIPDVKQLQHGEKRSLEGIDKMVRPPMQGPSSLRNQPVNNLPGGLVYVDTHSTQGGMRPQYEVTPRIQELEGKQEQVRMRVKRAMYEDLFLMFANSDRRQQTAYEVAAKEGEKLLALGPVLQHVNVDLLDPFVDQAFFYMAKAGKLPRPPEELEGMELKVEYVSILHQAQRMAGISSVERFTGFVGEIGKINPAIYDKVDSDQLVDEYADALGISPRIVRSDEDVAAIRKQRQEIQKAQQMAEMAHSAAGAARDLSQADLNGDNALSRIAGAAGGGGG